MGNNTSSEDGRFGAPPGDLRAKQTFTIHDGDVDAHRTHLDLLKGKYDWFIRFQSLPEWVVDDNEWSKLLAGCGFPTYLHVDIRAMGNCWELHNALHALLRALKYQKDVIKLLVYIPLSLLQDDKQFCFDMLMYVVLETECISLDRWKYTLVGE